VATDTGSGHSKVVMALRKWENGRTPEDGEPDEVVTSEEWIGPDGEAVTDPAVIAELEARLAAREQDEENG